MAIGDVYRIAFTWEDLNGIPRMVNVFHYRQLSEPEQPTPLRDLNTALRLEVWTPFLSGIGSQLRTNKADGFNLQNPTEGGIIIGTNLTGTATGDTMPYQTSPLIHWLTGLRGRSYRGRTFLPSTSEENSLAGGVISGAMVTLMGAFGDNAVDISATGAHGAWHLVVHSETLGISTDVNEFDVSPIIATVGRRKLNTGL